MSVLIKPTIYLIGLSTNRMSIHVYTNNMKQTVDRRPNNVTFPVKN